MGLESVGRTLRNIPLALRRKFADLTHKERVLIHHEYYHGEPLDLKDPKTINAKINWLKIYYQPPILNQLVDKYAVRDFVRQRVGEKYLNELLAVYDDARDVDFSELPEKFVIKGTHGCHYNLIVPDKSSLDKERAYKLFDKWLNRDYYDRHGGEWAYKGIPRRLIAEKFLKQKGQKILNDYKFFCFNGEPKFIQLDILRGEGDYRCYYDLDWKKQPFYTERNEPYLDEAPKPRSLAEMTEVSRKLSQGFPFVRVDLYDVDGRVVFGEMTFYPADGRKDFVPKKYNQIIGDMLALPKIEDDQPITEFEV
jgi:hypothetical protein